MSVPFVPGRTQLDGMKRLNKHGALSLSLRPIQLVSWHPYPFPSIEPETPVRFANEVQSLPKPTLVHSRTQ